MPPDVSSGCGLESVAEHRHVNCKPRTIGQHLDRCTSASEAGRQHDAIELAAHRTASDDIDDQLAVGLESGREVEEQRAVENNVAVADDPVAMAQAFGLAVAAGRLAFLSGPGAVREDASASSPLTGFLRD